MCHFLTLFHDSIFCLEDFQGSHAQYVVYECDYIHMNYTEIFKFTSQQDHLKCTASFPVLES